ncbi:hypothetical protein, partial [Tumidithrix helvetica]|uniref:hypothetical protein n=1 Tax=Tumidithrix helvetica TaxID=3457545 RepID=UPI003CC680BF
EFLENHYCQCQFWLIDHCSFGSLCQAPAAFFSFSSPKSSLIPFSKKDALHLFEKTALCAELKDRSVANLREIGISPLEFGDLGGFWIVKLTSLRC